MSALVVAGAGPSGLGCAIALAEGSTHEVRLIDRIPVVGGESGWANPDVTRLERQARAAGVQFDLGITAIRWSGGELLVSGPGRVENIPADHLFFAGGLRPPTVTDLGFTGDRPAGVIPASVAEHLLSSGQALWGSVIIVGDGPWAARIAAHVHHAGGRVVAASNSATAWADELVPLPSRGEVIGRDRVAALRLDGIEVDCDAIILAGAPLPNRNVDGALTESDPGVTFVQPLEIDGVERRSHHGALVARAWLTKGAQP